MVTHDQAVTNKAAIYDDGRIACDDEGGTTSTAVGRAKRLASRSMRAEGSAPVSHPTTWKR